MKKLTLLTALLLCLLGNAYAQTKADILSTTSITLGESNDTVRFMPNKLVSVDTSGAEVKTYIEPKIEFTKWNNEETLTLEIPSDVGYTDKTVDDKTGEVKMSNNKEGFYFKKYDAETLKFGIVWTEKPKQNFWTAKLVGYENLDFIYQPPLSAENPTGRKLRPDGVTYFDVRPENVVGSYAIYHKWKANHEIGKTNYGTGKLFHWYRPKFLDSAGNWTWGILEYKDGTMTETCPWEFLEKAEKDGTYPVRSNVDVGYTSGGASSEWISSSQTWYAKVNGTAASSGTMHYIHVWASGDAGAVAKFALYSDTGSDYPGNRLCVDASTFSLNTAKADVASPTDFELEISASTIYWIAVGDVETGNEYIYWDSGTDNNGFNIEVLPATAQSEPFDVYNYTSTKNSVYFTYTASGGEATPRRRYYLISKNEIYPNPSSPYSDKLWAIHKREEKYKRA